MSVKTRLKAFEQKAMNQRRTPIVVDVSRGEDKEAARQKYLKEHNMTLDDVSVTLFIVD